MLTPYEMEPFLAIIKDRDDKLEKALKDYEKEMQSLSSQYQKVTGQTEGLIFYLKKFHPEVGSNFEAMIKQGIRGYYHGECEKVTDDPNPKTD